MGNKPIDAYLMSYARSGSVTKVVVTSCVEEKGHSRAGYGAYWVTDNGMHRREAGINLYRVSETNAKILAEITELEKQSRELNQRLAICEAKLEHITPADLGVETENMEDAK